MNSKEYSPIFAASWMIGQGVASRSSHSAAAGRTTSAANPRTHSRRSPCSSVSSKSTTALRLRDVEQVVEVGGQAQVTLCLQLAGHERHHRVEVAADQLQELHRPEGHGHPRLVLGLLVQGAGAVVDDHLVRV